MWTDFHEIGTVFSLGTETIDTNTTTNTSARRGLLLHIFRRSVVSLSVCLSVCVLVTTVIPAKSALPNDIVHDDVASLVYSSLDLSTWVHPWSIRMWVRRYGSYLVFL